MNATAEWQQGHRELATLARRTKRRVVAEVCVVLVLGVVPWLRPQPARGRSDDGIWREMQRRNLENEPLSLVDRITTWAALNDPNRLGVLTSVASFGIIAALVVRDRRRLLQPEKQPGVVEVLAVPPDGPSAGHATSPVKPPLKPLFAVFRDVRCAMRLQTQPVLLVLSSTAPGLIVSESGRTVKCVVPLGFLQEVAAQPLRARGKVAHLLGRAAQGDTRLWSWLGLHARYSLLQTVLVDTPLALLAAMAFYGNFVAPLHSIPRGDDVSLALDVHTRFAAAYFLMIVVVPVAAVLTQFAVLAKCRRLAVFSADRAAMLYGHAGEYLKYLAAADRSHSSRRPEWLSLHPSPAQRLARAEDFARRHNL